MENKILFGAVLFIACLSSQLVNAQLKVAENGNVAINSGTYTPLSKLTMKTCNTIHFIICILLFMSCEHWELDIPKNDRSLYEQIEGTWNIRSYILPNGNEEPIVGDSSPILTFGEIHNDSCKINLHFVNYLQTMSILGENNRITILDQWGGTEIYDMSGQEDKLLDVLNNTNSGFIRNDSLFLIIDSQKKLKYKAVCFTR